MGGRVLGKEESKRGVREAGRRPLHLQVAKNSHFPPVLKLYSLPLLLLLILTSGQRWMEPG